MDLIVEWMGTYMGDGGCGITHGAAAVRFRAQGCLRVQGCLLRRDLQHAIHHGIATAEE